MREFVCTLLNSAVPMTLGFLLCKRGEKMRMQNYLKEFNTYSKERKAFAPLLSSEVENSMFGFASPKSAAVWTAGFALMLLSCIWGMAFMFNSDYFFAPTHIELTYSLTGYAGIIVSVYFVKACVKAKTVAGRMTAIAFTLVTIAGSILLII